MSMFSLAISCLITSNLHWFMDLTFQVPMQYCSLQHQSLLPSTVTCTAAAAAKSLQLYDSVQPSRWQPTRLPHPWGSPGKNTWVGCHFLLQCMKVKSEIEVAQLYPTLRDPIDCSLPGSSAWDFPGKSTGAGYHCLLHKQAWACAKLPQFCPTLCDLMHCSPPGSSVSTASKQYSPGKNTRVGCHTSVQGIFANQGIQPEFLSSPTLAGGLFTTSVTWEAIKHTGTKYRCTSIYLST